MVEESEPGEEQPKIGERVQFWQEQDRINRELIPRVLQQHELFARHVESHEAGDTVARSLIERLEARVGELERSRGATPLWVPYGALGLGMAALILAAISLVA